jgi:hypothetical protein
MPWNPVAERARSHTASPEILQNAEGITIEVADCKGWHERSDWGGQTLREKRRFNIDIQCQRSNRRGNFRSEGSCFPVSAHFRVRLGVQIARTMGPGIGIFARVIGPESRVIGP